ncbi:hypothetical protein MMC07_003362 [Pseudocyphellaria aurata]|nr:hypothetical protein [Pseudocyphellaria aurata]
MASSGEILKHLVEHPPKSPSRWPISYNFLVPNIKGLEAFFRARNGSTPSGAKADATASFRDTQSSDLVNQGIASMHGQEQPSCHATPAAFTEISVFTAATESFARANMNCTISESLERFKPIIALAKARNIRVRGYVSVALGCPYEGISVSPSKVAEVTTNLLEMGVDEVSIADTTGMGQKPRVLELFKMLSSFGIATKDLALHFHDTYGQALVNILLGLEYGIRTFDSSVGGLGGCPYAKGATGNVATEDLVYMLHSLGAKTGVDLEEMSKVGAWISDELGRPNDSRTGKAISSKLLASRVREDSLE